MNVSHLLGWTLAFTLLGQAVTAQLLHASPPTSRPAALQVPRNARPLPPREPTYPPESTARRQQKHPPERAFESDRGYEQEPEYAYERGFEEEVYSDVVAPAEPTRARPVSAQRVENHSVRSRPAVVHLTLLDDGTSSRPTNSASAGSGRRTDQRQHTAPGLGQSNGRQGEINRVSYQDREWTRRSDTTGGSSEFRSEGVRRIETSSNAFNDPFGNRRSASRPMTLAPAQNRFSTQNRHADSRISSRPSVSDSSDMAFFQENGRSSDCDRVYNDRNCCDDDAVCQQARQRLLRSPISAISLDISPRFNPTSQDTGRLPDRERTFEEETRTWRGRSGQRVAQGSLVGIENGRVLIRLTNGSIERVPLRELSDDDICYFAAWWGVPNVCTIGDETFAGRHFAPLTMTWKASALCHKPLYFEEVQLERYGHTTGPLIQPALSGAHFFLNIAALPYRAGINPPTECQYSLGYYRPGSCAPWMVPPIPLSVRGALMQAGAVVGGVAVIP